MQSPKQGLILTFVLLSFVGIGLSFLISKADIKFGVLIIAAIIGLPLLILFLVNTRFGYFFILIVSFFISLLFRVTEGLVFAGILEIVMLLLLVGIIIQQIRFKSHNDESPFAEFVRDPISIILIIWTLYVHLQLFNPSSFSLIGKLIAIRLSWYSLVGYIVTLYVLRNLEDIRVFIKISLGMSLLAALYGLSQYYIGFIPSERAWLFSDPVLVNAWAVGDKFRVWSFMNDPANFGLFMAFSGLICFALITGKATLKVRAIIMMSGLLMFWSMVVSSTRTAFVMVTFGFMVFGLLTINSFRTILLSFLILLFGLVIYFGPFYSAPIIRFRSAFKGNEDASMNVRSENRNRIQSYIYSHPIGGGPNTTGEVGVKIAPGHPLAGFPSDSEFLKIALEFGYIGLLLSLSMYLITCLSAIKLYFISNDAETKTILLMILVSIIALCSGNLTQQTASMKPFDFFIFSYMAIIVRLNKLNRGTNQIAQS